MKKDLKFVIGTYLVFVVISLLAAHTTIEEITNFSPRLYTLENAFSFIACFAIWYLFFIFSKASYYVGLENRKNAEASYLKYLENERRQD